MLSEELTHDPVKNDTFIIAFDHLYIVIRYSHKNYPGKFENIIWHVKSKTSIIIKYGTKYEFWDNVTRLVKM